MNRVQYLQLAHKCDEENKLCSVMPGNPSVRKTGSKKYERQ